MQYFFYVVTYVNYVSSCHIYMCTYMNAIIYQPIFGGCSHFTCTFPFPRFLYILCNPATCVAGHVPLFLSSANRMATALALVQSLGYHSDTLSDHLTSDILAMCPGPCNNDFIRSPLLHKLFPHCLHSLILKYVRFVFKFWLFRISLCNSHNRHYHWIDTNDIRIVICMKTCFYLYSCSIVESWCIYFSTIWLNVES